MEEAFKKALKILSSQMSNAFWIIKVDLWSLFMPVKVMALASLLTKAQ